MEHIITHHMPPVKSGKSYFLSGDKTEVYNLVMQTIAHPDQTPTHKKKEERRKMVDIIKCHILPVPRKKSYFLSRNVTYVTKLVKQTIFHPTRLVTHKSDRTIKKGSYKELRKIKGR